MHAIHCREEGGGTDDFSFVQEEINLILYIHFMLPGPYQQAIYNQ